MQQIQKYDNKDDFLIQLWRLSCRLDLKDEKLLKEKA
jgi:hypothetical protein